MVTGMLPVVVTDDVDRLKTFYRDVVGLPYFRVSDAEAAAGRLRKSGAVLVSALVQRPWGDRVAYFLDPDENLIAVADSKH